MAPVPNVGLVPVNAERRVAVARRQLFELENDVRILPAEIERVRHSVLGEPRPRTLAQAHRLICALESTLDAVVTEIPW